MFSVDILLLWAKKTGALATVEYGNAEPYYTVETYTIPAS